MRMTNAHAVWRYIIGRKGSITVFARTVDGFSEALVLNRLEDLDREFLV